MTPPPSLSYTNTARIKSEEKFINSHSDLTYLDVSISVTEQTRSVISACALWSWECICVPVSLRGLALSKATSYACYLSDFAKAPPTPGDKGLPQMPVLTRTCELTAQNTSSGTPILPPGSEIKFAPVRRNISG